MGGLRWKRNNQEGNEVQVVEVWVFGEEKQIRRWKMQVFFWGGGGLRRLRNQGSSCDCSCLGSCIKASESVNPNEL